MAALGEVPAEKLKDTVVVGELSLDGGLREVKGVLPIVTEAKEMGCSCCILPKGNAPEGRWQRGYRSWELKALDRQCPI